MTEPAVPGVALPDPSAGAVPSAPPRVPAPSPFSRVHELAAMLDRVDAATLPAVCRMIEIVRGRVAGLADREIGRVRRIGGRVRSARTGPAGGDPPALLESVGVAPGGLVERGARVLVLGLVALILVSAAAAILQGVDRDEGGSHPPVGNVPADAAAARPVVPAVTIGPGPRDPVPDYIGASRQSLATLTADAPAANLYAVASLTAAVPPADLLAVFGEFRVVEVFFTAGPGGQVEQAAVRDPVADVRAALASAAAQADGRAGEAARTGNTAARDQATTAAAELRAGCACLFAAVVRAPAARLSELATDPRVRVVDPAPPGSGPPAVRFVPLAPDRR